MALTKVTGDFIKAGSITQGHLHSSHGITTSHIAEGDKLFFTNARVDSRIGSLSSSDLSEGTNLYYTDARARAAISGTGSLSYNSTTGVMSFTMPAQNTSNITEGSNLYYTDARADARIAAADTGDLSEGTNLYYTQARFNTAFTAKSTSDLSEGTNLYYTNARADARIAAASTSDLSEGTNLYYTDARADARAALLVDSAPSTLDTLNELAAALGDDPNFATTVTNSIATKLPLVGGTMTGNTIHNDLVKSIYGTSSDGLEIYHDGSDSYISDTGTGGLILKSSNYFKIGNVLNTETYLYAAENGGVQLKYANSTKFETTSTGVSVDGRVNLSSTGLASSPTLSISNSSASSFIHTGELFAANMTASQANILVIGKAGSTKNAGYIGYNYSSAGNNNNYVTIGHWGENHLFRVYGDQVLSTVTLRGNVDMRAPIFYDKDDTNAYFDSGVLVLRSTDPTIYMRDTDHRSVALHNNSNRFYVLGAPADSTSYAQINGVWPWYVQLDTNDVYTGSVGYAGSSYRAPIFYDRDNTGYYVNPNATSNVNAITWSGGSSANANTAYGWGDHASPNYHSTTSMLANRNIASGTDLSTDLADGGAYGSYGAANTSWNAPGSYGGVLAWSFTSNINGQIFYDIRHNTSDYSDFWFRSKNNLGYQPWSKVWHSLSPDIRAPIFYDRDDTGYYVNPNATSNVNAITWSGGSSANANTAYTHSQAAHAPSNANYITNNNQLTNGAGYLTSSIGGTRLDFGSGATGATFANNHYSMGVDIANSSWDSPHYSDLIIGYHTGIRFGASYSGMRFYANSPTTDTNNTGHGNGGEALIFTVGGAAGTNDTKVEGIGYAGESFRAPIFYDSNNTAYFYEGDNSASLAGTMNIHGGTGGSYGNQLIVGQSSLALPYTLQDGNIRPVIAATGQYPVLHLNHTVTSNTAHGPTIQFTYDGLSGRQWMIGGGGTGEDMQIGYSDTALGNANYNPHNGISGYSGVTYMMCKNNGRIGLGAAGDWGYYGGGYPGYAIDTRGTLYNNTDVRAPIFYDSDNTAYYVDGASNSHFNTMSCAGGLTFGSDYGVGVTGLYTSTRIQTIFNMGAAYKVPNDGASTANAYGLYWSHPNAGSLGGANNLNDHGLLIINNGTFRAAISSRAVFSSDVRGTLFYDYENTGYYVDPNGTSNLNTVNIAGGTFNGTLNGNATTANRTNSINGYGHPGTGMYPFFNWGGGNGGTSAPTSSSYTTGISVGSHPGDQAYGFQLGNNMWNTALWMRNYNSGYSSWYQMIDSSSNSQTKTGVLQSDSSLRAPIFYDSANTAYYTRPASSSYINSLETAGSIQAGTSGTGSIYVGGTSSNYFRFHVNSAVGAATFFDMNSGNINWRQGSSTRYIFYSTTANMTIYGTLTQGSDIRIKENIVEISDCIDKVKSIRGVYYNRTDFNTEPTKIGVIAQEVEKQMPELVHDEPTTGIKSVSYTELTAILVNAIKEQQVIIDDLKSRIETLEN